VNYNPRFAVGTYADVLDWITRALVDVAVLSPNAFAETTAWQQNDGNADAPKESDCIYIATEGKMPAAPDAWVNEALKTASEPGKGRFEYNSVCIVARNSRLENFDQLSAATKANKIRFVFGDPLSASATILPMHFLRMHGIDFRKNMEYSFGHKDSREMILEQKLDSGNANQVEKVAFVQDLEVLDTQWNTPKDNRGVLKLISETETIKGMKDELLPMEVWVARKDFDKGTDLIANASPTPTNTQRLRSALLAHVVRKRQTAEEAARARGQGTAEEKSRPPVGQMRDFTYHEKQSLESRIAPLHSWAREIKGLLARPLDAPLNGNYSDDPAGKVSGMKAPIRFQDVISLVRHYNKIYKDEGKKARLALVLSGGGAKCAYQAGAIEKMESILGSLREDRKPDRENAPSVPEIDIELVAGTSGGALNAIPVAVGISREREQGKDPPLARTWKELNALKIISPPRIVAVCLGLCYAFIYFVLIRGFVRLLRKATAKLQREDRWMRLLGWLFILIPAAVFLLFSYPRALGPLLLTRSHIVLYFLLATSCGIFVCFLLCFFWGILILANARRHLVGSASPRPIHHRLVSVLLRWSDPRQAIPFLDLSLVGMLLIGVALGFALFNAGGLFRGEPLENVVIDEYAKLFNTSSSGDYAKGRGIGKAIFNDPRRKRDLVITGSSLSEDSRGSKYFYLPRIDRIASGPLPSYGKHGVEISQDCDIDSLIDLALGSGTIFPFFPSHHVPENNVLTEDHTRRYALKPMDLIDGGFAHNSPIEAATLWKATHIILIDASPETTQKGKPKSPFVVNILKAIGYLFDQAQAADVNAQEEAGVFTLRPSQAARPQIGILDFSPGFADVALERGRNDAAGWSFVRQPAKPLFWDANVVVSGLVAATSGP